MSGTDTPNAYVFPGFALHDELELLVDAGLTPAGEPDLLKEPDGPVRIALLQEDECISRFVANPELRGGGHQPVLRAAR